MARPLRIEYPGAVYHVTSRGNRRENIFLTDQDRITFLSILGQVCQRFNWFIHAYCLMDNHYHLLIETPDANLSRGMRQLNGVYTQTHNRHNQRVGHVFQGRFKAILVQKDAYLLELSRYIVLNPVRAGMVQKAEDWLWSSYAATAGEQDAEDWLAVDGILAMFAVRKKIAQRKYRVFIEQGHDQPSVWESLKGQVFLGDEAFVEKELNKVDSDNASDEIPARQRRPVCRPIADYEKQSQTRNEAICLAYQSGQYSLKDLGDYFDLHYSRISRIVKQSEAKDKT